MNRQNKLFKEKYDDYSKKIGRKLLIVLPFLWYGLLFVIPFFIVLKISFAEQIFAIPPFSNLIKLVDGTLHVTLNFSNYLELFKDNIYLYSFINSLQLASVSTFICFIIGFPFAYAIAKAPKKYQSLLILAVMLPSWTSFLIRIYAWMNMLGVHGLLNKILLKWGLIKMPLIILDTKIAVYIGVVYTYLPYMILPVYSSLKAISPDYIRAADDLGSKPFNTLIKITIPLSIKGVLAGAFLVFIPVIGEVMIPQLMGGTNSLMIGNLVWQTFFYNNDWPMASTLAMVILFLIIFPVRSFNKIESDNLMKKDK